MTPSNPGWIAAETEVQKDQIKSDVFFHLTQLLKGKPQAQNGNTHLHASLLDCPVSSWKRVCQSLVNQIYSK